MCVDEHAVGCIGDFIFAVVASLSVIMKTERRLTSLSTLFSSTCFLLLLL